MLPLRVKAPTYALVVLVANTSAFQAEIVGSNPI